jgi:hypothetical protein
VKLSLNPGYQIEQKLFYLPPLKAKSRFSKLLASDTRKLKLELAHANPYDLMP